MSKESKKSIRQAIDAVKEAREQAMKDINEEHQINYAKQPKLFERMQLLSELNITVQA